MGKRQVIDMHVHFGAPEDGESGCYWSEEFTRTPAYLAMLMLTKSLFKKVDIKRVKHHLFDVINGSIFVDKCVLLAMDEVYDDAGVAHREMTHLFVPNHYIAELARTNERVLFGASIHPLRPDWSDELDYCLENRAVVCKWIPSSQLIDPEHAKCRPFYKRLADHNLPLLYHAGPQHSIPTSDEGFIKYNNPKYLRKILDKGVTVIVAHCAMPYFGLLDADYQDDFGEFLKLMEEADQEGWRLYADLSAVCSPYRTMYMELVLEHLEGVAAQKLLFGSDYPIPLSEICYNKSTDFFSRVKHILKAQSTANFLDRNYVIIGEMNIGDDVFFNATRLFDEIKY
jgi:mannonate dehydratase